jgi:hypothetical protein
MRVWEKEANVEKCKAVSPGKVLGWHSQLEHGITTDMTDPVHDQMFFPNE